VFFLVEGRERGSYVERLREVEVEVEGGEGGGGLVGGVAV